MFDPYRQWLKIPSEQRPPTHYELLGLPPHESDAARIHTAVMQRMALVRRYQLGEHAETVAALLNELSAAFNCLSDPQRRREYDDQLRAAADSRTTPVAAAAAQSGSLPSISTEPATVRPAIHRKKTQRLPWLLGALLAAAAVAAITWFSRPEPPAKRQPSELVAGNIEVGRPATAVLPSAAESSIRYFGYATAGPGTVIDEFAPYTNVVFVRDWVEHPSGVLMNARRAGLPMVLCLQGKEMVDGTERLKGVLQRGAEPILAICWLFPYMGDTKPSEVIRVGRRLKQEHPGVQYWIACADKAFDAFASDIVPRNVDALVVAGLADTTPKLVAAKAEECFPHWIEQARGRPIIWLWLSNSRFTKAGQAPATSPGTFRAYLEQARRYKLAGLVFDSYGKPEWQQRPALESRPELIDEIRQISRELGFDRANSPGVPIHSMNEPAVSARSARD